MNRQALEKLKRTDLQRLCREYGIKANLKTETLIDLLEKCSTSDQTSPRKRVATRAGTRGLDRTNSMDGEDSEAPPTPANVGNNLLANGTAAESSLAAVVQTRSRKAKDQTRLGVGRPALVGGSGPHPIMPKRSVRTSRSRQAEPDEPLCIVHEDTPIEQEQEPIAPPTTDTSPDSVQQAVQPLRSKIKSLEAQVSLLQNMRTELDYLKSQQSSQQSDMSAMHNILEHLTAELYSLKNPQLSHQDKGKAPLHPNTLGQFIKSSSDLSPTIEQSRLPHPSAPPLLLGKRHRDSTCSTISGVVEAGKDEDLTEEERNQTVIRPTKKRPRIGSYSQDRPVVASSSRSSAGLSLLPSPALAVENVGCDDSSLDDDAPPATPLPPYLGPITPPPRPVPTNNDIGMLSTPTSSFPAHIPTFPLEEPPSPSPPSNRIIPMNLRGSLSRTVSPAKSAVGSSSSAFAFGSIMPSNPDGLNSFMNPGPSLRIPSDSGLFNFDMGTPTTATKPSSSRTMYGTEVDKFDFGFDGLSGGFWGS